MNKGEDKMKKEYKGYKTIQLDYEYDNSKNDGWDTVGKRDKYICPECQYLGTTCPRCGGEE